MFFKKHPHYFFDENERKKIKCAEPYETCWMVYAFHTEIKAWLDERKSLSLSTNPKYFTREWLDNYRMRIRQDKVK